MLPYLRVCLRRWWPRIVLPCPLLLLFLNWSRLSTIAQWMVFFLVSILTLFLLSLAISPSKLNNRPVPEKKDHPAVPNTLAGIYPMGSQQFEIFSAAVLIALGEGLHFFQQNGQSGDQGVKVFLLNQFGQYVLVQSRLYPFDRPVDQSELRDFLGSICFHQAVYGYFITTSRFTESARQWITSTHGRIRAIDGDQLESLLQHRQKEIALSLTELLSKLQA